MYNDHSNVMPWLTTTTSAITNKDKIGFTCGAFDLLHAGHILMLEEAANNCDYLIVGLHSNPGIDRPNKNKPIQSLYERWVQLSALDFIDKIIPYETEDELYQILLSQDIDVRFIGEEYKDSDFTGKDIIDIEIFYNKRKHKFSSSELRKRVSDSIMRLAGKYVK